MVSIVQTEGTITLNGEFLDGVQVDYVAYQLDSMNAPEVGEDEEFLTGCDYSTVAVTDNKQHVDELIGMLSTDDLEYYFHELDTNCVVVYKFSGLYFVSIEHEYFPNAIADKMCKDFITFGAFVDDVDIGTCIPGYRYIHSKGIPLSEIEEFDIECLDDEQWEDENQMDETESGIDFLTRVVEYNSNHNHALIHTIFEKMDHIY